MTPAPRRTHVVHGNRVTRPNAAPMPVERMEPRQLHRMVELIALLASIRRWNRWALAYRTTVVVLRRSRFARRLALAAALLAVGVLATLGLLGTLVAHTL